MYGNVLLSRQTSTILRSGAFRISHRQQARGFAIVKMKIGDIAAGGAIRNRATVMPQKTKRPVQFELMAEARQTVPT
jgi:hypothetical protein